MKTKHTSRVEITHQKKIIWIQKYHQWLFLLEIFCQIILLHNDSLVGLNGFPRLTEQRLSETKFDDVRIKLTIS